MSNTHSHRSAILSLVVAAGLLWLAHPAQARADDTYAAIAYSEKTGHYGYGFNFDTREAAEQRALSECKGDDAKIVVWARNAWAALAVSDNGHYGWAYGDSEESVKNTALQKCKDAGGTNAHIAVYGYSSK